MTSGITTKPGISINAGETVNVGITAVSGVSIGTSASSSGPPPNYLPNVGWTSDLGLVDANTLPDFVPDIPGGANYMDQSRTSPLTYKNFDLSPWTGTAVVSPGKTAYSAFIWADTVIINSGQGVFSTFIGICPYPTGETIAGGDGFFNGSSFVAGNGGSGGAGGGGGSANDVGIPLVSGNGSTAGTSGTDGTEVGGTATRGYGGGGTGANDMTGNAFTTITIGSSSIPGIGAGGDAGDCTAEDAAPGGGAGGAYIGIVCNTFGGDVGGSGLFATGGNAGAETGLGQTTQSFGGDGGLIEVFCKKYTGSIVPFTDAGSNSQFGTGSNGTIRIYELNSAGAIIATHTDVTDTWDNL